MTQLSRRWILLPPLTPEERDRFGDLNPALAQILFNRGFNDYDAAISFLSGEGHLYDPMKMKGMHQAVGRIREAIRKAEPIVVYGDFDADGVTSTVLLVQTLHSLGAKVRPYIPDRVDEGYGLNKPALIQLAGDGARLIITVDCGIRSVEEVKAGQAAGLDIIVTDHHSIGEVIPEALAVLNPKQVDCPYPEDMLAGVGVAFKLADALIRVQTAMGPTPPNISTQDLVDLVAIGTVADLAPLDRLENRMFVQMGLQELNRARRPGVYALLSVAGIEPGSVSASSIGFGLGPRINAAGRLESAMTAYDLLMAEDIDTAMSLAQTLQELNVSRQELTAQAQEEARILAEADRADVPLIFAASPHFQSGIVGLVAGRLVEEYYRPAVVVELVEEGDRDLEEGQDEEGAISRGSCRSIPEVNITEALDDCADLLIRHGGHAQAAGFSVKTENLPALRERLMSIVSGYIEDAATLEPTITIDARLPLAQASLELAQELQRLEPTGHRNNVPLFMTERLKVLEARAVGRDRTHLKLRLGDGPTAIDGIAFRRGDMITAMPRYVDVAYYLEINEWNGRVTPQMNVHDIRAAAD